MEYTDPYQVRLDEKTALIHEFVENPQKTDKDSCATKGHVTDECFVLARSTSGSNHPMVEAELAVQTALWVYRHIHVRTFYWSDKRLLLERVLRTTNLALYQKRRDPGFETGVFVELAVVIASVRSIWIGMSGSFRGFVFRKDQCIWKSIPRMHPTWPSCVGNMRYGYKPWCDVAPFVVGDTCLLFSDDGHGDSIDEQAIQLAKKVGQPTNESFEHSVQNVIHTVCGVNMNNHVGLGLRMILT